MLELIAINSTYLANGDIFGYVGSIYGDVLGDLVGGVILFIIFLGFYIRTQSLIYPSIVWIIIGGILESQIPTPFLSVGKGLIILSIGLLLYSLFLRSK